MTWFAEQVLSDNEEASSGQSMTEQKCLRQHLVVARIRCKWFKYQCKECMNEDPQYDKIRALATIPWSVSDLDKNED